MTRKYLPLLLILNLIVLTGCATKINQTKTGFLNTYSGFIESAVYEGMMVDKSSGRDIGEYSKFLIDKPMMYFDSSESPVGVDAEFLNELTQYFYDESRKALEENYTVVDAPGEGVLRIRTAITNIVPSKPMLNVHWSTKVMKAGTGGASLEAEFIDSVTHERILAVIDSRHGRGLQYHKGLSKWGYTKDALLQWAKMLVKYLDEYNK